MKLLVLTVLLAVLQTAPQAPRITSKEGASEVKQNNPNPTQNKAPSNTPSATPQQSSSSVSDTTKQRVGEKEPETPITISKLPNVTVEKDRYDYIAIACTVLLFIVGAVGICAAVGTLKTIQKQTHYIKRQSILMRRSTEATEKSIRMQEAQLRQWIDVSEVHTSIRTTPHGKVPEGIIETPLFVNFTIDNPTSMIVTLNWVIIRIDGIRQKPQFFSLPLNPTSDPIPIHTSTMLKGHQLDAYKIYRLYIPLIVYVGFTDAFNRPRQQHFSCLCQCGPPASTSTLPYKGDIPDDGIQESDKNPN